MIKKILYINLVTIISIFFIPKLLYSLDIEQCKISKDINSNINLECGKLFYKSNKLNDAFKHFKKGCQLGNKQSCYWLGWCYFNGKGVQKNYKKAYKVYSKINLITDKVTLSNLAWLYRYGKGTKKDIKKAINYYKRACELKNVDACLSLSNIYNDDNEYNKAYKYVIKSAKYCNSNDSCANKVSKYYKEQAKILFNQNMISKSLNLLEIGCDKYKNKECCNFLYAYNNGSTLIKENGDVSRPFVLEAQDYAQHHYAISKDKKYLVTITKLELRIYDINRKKLIYRFKQNESNIPFSFDPSNYIDIYFDSNNTLNLLTGSQIIKFNLKTKKSNTSFRKNISHIKKLFNNGYPRITFSSKNGRYTVFNAIGKLYINDNKKQKIIKSVFLGKYALKKLIGTPRRVKFSDNSKYIIYSEIFEFKKYKNVPYYIKKRDINKYFKSIIFIIELSTGKIVKKISKRG